MFGSNKHFVNMFVGANGTSKTATGANIIANIAFGAESPWFRSEAFDYEDPKTGKVYHRKALPQKTIYEDWPYEKRGRIISNPTTIKEKIIPELKKWFPVNEAKNIPEANFEEAKEGKAYVSKIITKTGWTIDILSTEQDVEAFESVDLGFCLIDEPMPKDKFMATLARGRLGMSVFWMFTPLFHAAWIKDWIDDNLLPTGKNIEALAGMIEAEMEDNCEIHGVRGFFKHEHIQRIADSYEEDEKQARVFGKFGHLIGRVHKSFKREIHVIEPFVLDPKDWTTYQAIDTHPRAPDHVMYMSVNNKGTKIISGEIVSEGTCKKLYTRGVTFEKDMSYRIETRLIDPSAYNDDQHKEEKTTGDQLEELGWYFIKGSKNLTACIKKTDEALSYDKKDGLMIRPPEIYIFKSCPVTIKQLDEYVWSEYKGAAKDEKQSKPSPRDKDDHQPENMHRLLIADFKHVPWQYRQPVPLPSSGMSEVADSGYDPYAKE